MLLKLVSNGFCEDLPVEVRGAAEAPLEMLARLQGPIETLREDHRTLLRQTEGRPTVGDELLLVTRRYALSAQRQTLIKLRMRGAIGDDALHVVEEELHWFEFYTERWMDGAPRNWCGD
jgi:hypothetical protein